MKQTIFETRQRANEIQKETLAIWRQSDQSDYLEGIENDPIFSLLMMALSGPLLQMVTSHHLIAQKVFTMEQEKLLFHI